MYVSLGGVILLVAMVFVLLYFLCIRRRNSSSEEEEGRDVQEAASSNNNRSNYSTFDGGGVWTISGEIPEDDALPKYEELFPEGGEGHVDEPPEAASANSTSRTCGRSEP